MTPHFITYMDSNYAARGLVMIESLLRWCPDARLTVLCLNEPLAQILTREVGRAVTMLSPEPLAVHEPRLAEVRAGRTPWEFYATQKPVLISWVLERMPMNSLVAYIDADTFFFSSPMPAFEEAEGASIVISPHRFNAATAFLSKYGTYNAGFGIWRHDEEGLGNLHAWRDQCLEWCHASAESDGRFMNQGYLNAWPSQYAGLKVSTHPGLNLAPWNVGSHQLKEDASGLTVDGLPLVFYHFSSVHRTPEGQWWTFDMDSALHQDVVLQGIYRPYLAALKAASTRLLDRHGILGTGSVREMNPSIPVLKLPS